MNKYLLALFLFPTLANAAASKADPKEEARACKSEMIARAEAALAIDDKVCAPALAQILHLLPTVLLPIIMDYGKPGLPEIEFPTLQCVVDRVISLDMVARVNRAHKACNIPKKHMDLGSMMSALEYSKSYPTSVVEDGNQLPKVLISYSKFHRANAEYGDGYQQEVSSATSADLVLHHNGRLEVPAQIEEILES